MSVKRWFCISVGQSMSTSRYIGKVFATLDEVRQHLGPWIDIQGNHILVFGKPPKL